MNDGGGSLQEPSQITRVIPPRNCVEGIAKGGCHGSVHSVLGSVSAAPGVALWAGELDAEYGAKARKVSDPQGPAVAKASEMDAETRLRPSVGTEVDTLAWWPLRRWWALRCEVGASRWTSGYGGFGATPRLGYGGYGGFGVTAEASVTVATAASDTAWGLVRLGSAWATEAMAATGYGGYGSLWWLRRVWAGYAGVSAIASTSLSAITAHTRSGYSTYGCYVIVAHDGVDALGSTSPADLVPVDGDE